MASMSTTPGPTPVPNRLLAASRVVHQLSRTQDTKGDLTKLLQDEAYGRQVLKSASVYADAKTKTLLGDFEKSSVDCGVWRALPAPASPAYTPGADGMVSAAAAWDPNYNPPASAVVPGTEVEYVPTTSPRTSTTVKETGTSSFLSRFGFSRPVEPGDAGRASRSASPRTADSALSGKSSQSPPADAPDAPVDPKHKKYIGGAR